MGIFSGFVTAISGWFSGIGSKFVMILISILVFLAIAAVGYFYVHGKDVKLAAAQAALAQAQSQLNAAQAANNTDINTINALRAQQSQTEAAQAALLVRDQNLQNEAANLTSLIEHDTCAPLPVVKISGNSKAPATTGEDGPVAPVLNDTLAALAAVQAKQGGAP